MSYEEEKQDRKIEQLEAEIERVRAASIEYQNALDDVRNLKEQIETFHLRRENELRQMNELSWQNKTQAARIQELEGALAEYQRLGKTISEVVVPCLTAHGNCDQCRPKAKAACDAIETIRKGKIGSGDHIGEPNKLIGPDAKPRSWQITDERVDALRSVGKMEAQILPQKAWDVLRAMLEASQ